MAGQWTFIDASDWDLAGTEPQGQTPHPWLRHRNRQRTWLFKQAVVQANCPLTEDLTEKIASEFAQCFGIPAAKVDLAQREGVRGCLVEDLRWSRGSDQPGQVLLAGMLGDYDPNHKQHHGHSLTNIQLALAGYGCPPLSPTPGTSMRSTSLWATSSSTR